MPKDRQMRANKRATVCAFVTLFLAQVGGAEPVTIRFVDSVKQSLVPVRVELLSSEGSAQTATNALPLSQDCALAPLPAWLAQPPPVTLHNPYAGTEQHYVDGIAHYDLPPGKYRLRAFKGSEYSVVERELVVAEGGLETFVELSKWSGESDWIAADVHLHLTRMSAERNEKLARWMAAEGLQIANLLQMGALSHFAAAPQYAFGEDGTYKTEDTLLIPGQEHPRTHFFGHTLSLAATDKVDQRGDYILFNKTFTNIRQLGGISGFAHWGAGPSRRGLAINVPQGNVELLEVLSFELLYVETWYQLLNLGYPIAAVAGTDFPCLPGIPGRERTYIDLQGELSRANMVRALRAGRSFVTNGPMLELTVNGQGIGSRIDRSANGGYWVAGGVRFDPGQDRMQQVQLIADGVVVRSWNLDDSGLFRFEDSIAPTNVGWIALRAVGEKLGETHPVRVNFPAWMQAGFDNWMSGGSSDEVGEYFDTRKVRASYAHTSPIYVDGASSIGDAQVWVTRLEELAALLEKEDLADELIWHWLPYSDGVGAEHLKQHRPALLQQIQAAKAEFQRRRP